MTELLLLLLLLYHNNTNTLLHFNILALHVNDDAIYVRYPIQINTWLNFITRLLQRGYSRNNTLSNILQFFIYC